MAWLCLLLLRPPQARNITTTSLLLTWLPPRKTFTRVTSYRISMNDTELGQGMQAYLPDTQSLTNSLPIVNLKPGRGYRFHVAGLTTDGHIVPGTCQRSGLITTQLNAYIT